MLRDVRHEITDGLLGLSKYQGTGVHVKIGASPIVSAEPVVITGSMSADRIKEYLGLSPLQIKPWTAWKMVPAGCYAFLWPPVRREELQK